MKKGILVISLFILALCSLVLIIHSSYFEVKDIQIEGLTRVQSEEIIKTIGELKGQNIFLIPGREIVNRLISFRRIKGAKLERKLPGTLIIKINERDGLAVFRSDENWIELCEEGKILQIYDESKLPDLPRVNGLNVEMANNQVSITVELKRFLGFMQGLLPMQNLINYVSYISEDVQVTFKSNAVLYLGEAIDLDKKITI
ncbi:MAG: FtsQ-type POTRA domain-containing protein, partial [Desulfobacterales bacterium]|nr:FtsQ-type POTRA domain-containing protein [Desulfobacterales bacterium]